MTNNENVIQHPWGYELYFAKNKNYCGKILVFHKKYNKTPFIVNKDTDKTFFVNQGLFSVKWIDTTTGKIFQTELKEGDVWHCESMKPSSLEALSDNSSVTEVNSGYIDDNYTIISAENF